jgi:hypothetical protein
MEGRGIGTRTLEASAALDEPQQSLGLLGRCPGDEASTSCRVHDAVPPWADPASQTGFIHFLHQGGEFPSPIRTETCLARFLPID